MTEPQNNKYWREWGAVWRVLKGNTNETATQARHRLHREALHSATDVSHTAFTNDQFSEVLGKFWSISKPADLNAQLRQARMKQTNLIHTILNHQIPCLAILLQPKYFPENFPDGAWLGEGSGDPSSNHSAASSSSTHSPTNSLTHSLVQYFRPATEDDVRHAEKFVQSYMIDVYKCHDLQQLSYEPRPRGRSRSSALGHPSSVLKSDLECLRDTVSVRINDLRAGLGLTIHDMLTLASLTCECAQCCKQRRAALRIAANQPEPITA
jgi:hypothetical protein